MKRINRKFDVKIYKLSLLLMQIIQLVWRYHNFNNITAVLIKYPTNNQRFNMWQIGLKSGDKNLTFYFYFIMWIAFLSLSNNKISKHECQRKQRVTQIPGTMCCLSTNRKPIQSYIL